MQPPELIDDEEQWEVEEIVDKVKNKEGVWYKVKWTGWGDIYNEWVPEEELDKAPALKRKYEQQPARMRKRNKR
ncbi:hypothetical protein N7G274_007661 [Stereocaulon virgatum]|uniref:Chromo domain-containing protein n=1 Tax=Stereocaulon virgatum TaxID=373712 RepID=A0ABR4A1H6_9LECA